MRTLYGLAQSPWTEKARWALDHHGVSYRYHEHVPLLGEVLLRMKAKNRNGEKPSVPLLVDGDDTFGSSVAIARHADAVGKGEKLIPDALDADVMRWVDLSDRIMNVGRAQVFRGYREHPASRREALPPFIPGPLRGALSPMVGTVTSFLASKYDVETKTAEQTTSELRALFGEAEAALGSDPKGKYLVGDRFTFADASIASALRAVRPEENAPMGPATRKAWSNDALAADYEDTLLAWRDALYAKHRAG